jgi:intein/homing endonuclease
MAGSGVGPDGALRHRPINNLGAIGELGAGKTLSLTFLAWKNWFYRHKTIYSNYHLYKIPYIYIDTVEKLDAMREGFAVLDEFWLWIDSRTTRSNKNKIVADILLKSRKRGLTWCLPPGQLIICNPSVKPIENVDYSDKVLTQGGTFEKVMQKHIRWYEGDMIKITPHKLGIPFELTPNHKVCIGDGLGMDAGLLAEGQEIMYPIVKETKDTPEIRLSEYFSEKKTQLRGVTGKISKDIKDNKIDTSKRGWWKGKYDIDNRMAYYIKSKLTNPNKIYGWRLEGDAWRLPCDKTVVKNTIRTSEDFMKFAGLYVADGSSDHGSISIALNLKEAAKAESYAKIIKDVFGVEPKIRRYPKVGLLKLCFSAYPISKTLKEMFGHGAINKKVPAWFLTLPREKQKAFIQGYMDGDGYEGNRGEKSLETASPTLHYQVLQMLLRCGIKPNTMRRPNRKSNNKIYRTYWNRTSRTGRITESGYMIPIRKIERYHYKGPVYNIGVENDHSYSLISGSAFNCFTAQLLDLLDKRVRKVMDFTAYPILNTAETICKVSIFRTGYPKAANYLKTFYFKTQIVFDLYNHREEIEQLETETEDEDMPEMKPEMKIVFQESMEAEPMYFNSWAEADKHAEEYWKVMIGKVQGKI